MADPTLHIDVSSSSAQATTDANWTDITALTGSATIAGTGSVVIMIACVSFDEQLASDSAAAFRFTVDGSPEGPCWNCAKDSTTLSYSTTMLWAVTGLSAASHDFDVQMQRMVGITNNAGIGSNYTHTFQVIELTDSASILLEQTTANGDYSGTGVTWTTIESDTVTPSASAHHIFTGGFVCSRGTDKAGHIRFSVDGTRDGPYAFSWADDNNQGNMQGIVWFTDALANTSQVLAMQGYESTGSWGSSSDYPQGFQVIEITADVDLLSDKALTSASTAPASWANVTDMSDTVSPSSASSVVLLAAVLGPDDGGADDSADFRIQVAGSTEGPTGTCAVDNPLEFQGYTTCYASTGNSGSTAYALQWQQRASTQEIEVAYERSFQLLELQAAAAASRFPYESIEMQRRQMKVLLTR